MESRVRGWTGDDRLFALIACDLGRSRADSAELIAAAACAIKQRATSNADVARTNERALRVCPCVRVRA